jgi:hypothetical protein
MTKITNDENLVLEFELVIYFILFTMESKKYH